jgi:hypothetical protein
LTSSIFAASSFHFFEDGEEDFAGSSAYVPENNLPMGISHYKGRLFITMVCIID